MLASEPLFVDRTAEPAELETPLSDLAKARRRHMALMGLRRIGKTMLLDEVRRRYPAAAIAYAALDELVHRNNFRRQSAERPGPAHLFAQFWLTAQMNCPLEIAQVNESREIQEVGE